MSVNSDLMIEKLKGRKIKSILELGCANGDNLIRVGEGIGARMAGCDKHQGTDEYGFEFRVRDLNNKLDYKSKSFDAVIFSATLYQMENIKTAISEAKRIAKKFIVVCEMHEEEPHPNGRRGNEHWRNYKPYFPSYKIEEYPISGWPGTSGQTKLLICQKHRITNSQ